MAHHGGRPVPRAHRARAPTMSVQQTHPLPLTRPLTAPLAPLRPVPPVHATTAAGAATATVPVTLQAPRPDAERATNEYVETPFRPSTANPTPPDPDKASAVTPLRFERPAQLQLVAPAVPVTKQPVAFTKEHPASVPSADTCTSSSGNIICSECGRCRCASCRTPRPLPQRWVCDNSCLCSADAIIDYASCLCCVKALYYHCSDSDAGATCADEPCSCGPHRRLARWACLGALAIGLPCLLCYWPLRGCQRAVEAAYARHSRAGCRCRPHLATPEKRLLDASPDF